MKGIFVLEERSQGFLVEFGVYELWFTVAKKQFLEYFKENYALERTFFFWLALKFEFYVSLHLSSSLRERPMLSISYVVISNYSRIAYYTRFHIPKLCKKYSY